MAWPTHRWSESAPPRQPIDLSCRCPDSPARTMQDGRGVEGEVLESWRPDFGGQLLHLPTGRDGVPHVSRGPSVLRYCFSSDPCTISAQMTRMSMAIIMTDQIGYAARKPMFTTALIITITTPRARAQLLPVKSAKPATAMMIPRMR